MTLRILIADRLDEDRVQRLVDSGHDVRVAPDLTAVTLADRVGDAEVLVVRSTKVRREAFTAATDLALTVRAGAGTDNIDLSAASERGVYVCNVPGKNAIAVAELTMALLLAIDRHIADGAAELRAGRWDKKRFSVAEGLHGKRMAILGLGDIGLAVAERASAFGLDVVALRKPGRSAAALSRVRSAGVRFVDSMDELLDGADVVSLHVPSTPDTVGLLGPEEIALLPDGAILLNTARGDVVDGEALLHALDERGFRAGLDVYPGEPTEATTNWMSALAAHPNVVGSHHIGASTQQAQQAVADGVIEVIEAFAAGRVENCVNLARRPRGRCSLVIRHKDQVGVLASVLTCLRERDINVQQMQNQVFDGDGPTAAVATIRVSRPVDADTVASLHAIDAVYAVRVQSEDN